MRKKVVVIAVIVVLIGAFIRLFSPYGPWLSPYGPWFRLGMFTVGLRFIGDVIGLVGVILLIYALIAKNP